LPGAGVYRIDTTKSVILKSNVDLLFEPGAVLEAIPNDSIALTPVVRGDDVSNVSIRGPGLVRGEWDAHMVHQDQFQASVDLYDGDWRLFVPPPGALSEPVKDAQGRVVSWGDHGMCMVIAQSPPATRNLHTRVYWDFGGSQWFLDKEAAASAQLSNALVTPLRGEAGMGVSLHGVVDFVLEGFTVESCWGDGIFLRGTINENGNPLRLSSNGIIRGVTARRNRRNNLSIIDAHNIRVLGGEYCEAGYPTEIHSAGAPASYQAVVDCGLIGVRCGIDIEPDQDSDRQVHHVEIAGVSAYGNIYDGIHATNHGCWDIEIHDNTCCDNGKEWPSAGSRTRPEDGSGIHLNRTRAISVYCNECDRNVKGIWISGDSSAAYTSVAYRPAVWGNTCRENRKEGVHVKGHVRGGGFHGNVCILNREEGILLEGETGENTCVPECVWPIADCEVSSNTCVGNSHGNAQEADNMMLTGHCYNNVIRGNDLGLWDGKTFARHALCIEPKCYRTLVRDNFVKGAGLGPPVIPPEPKDFRDNGKRTDHDYSP
jgi:hypothetical protein